jgi:hypothetical protein
MKQTTFELMINRIVESEKKSAVLSQKNKELNAIKQSYESKMTMMKNNITLLEARLEARIREIKQEDND